MKFSVGVFISLLATFWITPQIGAASSSKLSKVIVALKPDKDPDAMMAERNSFRNIFQKRSENLLRSSSLFQPP